MPALAKTRHSSAWLEEYLPTPTSPCARVFEEVKAIADTGFLIAFGNRNDLHHKWAVGLARHVGEPLLTCEAVLAETAFHLGNAALVLDFVHSGLVRPAFALADHTPRIAELPSATETACRIWPTCALFA
jgi:predicted nucleic acid-binding protein